MQNRYFSDEELVAYLDGESEHANIDEITSALKSDVKLNNRIDGLKIDKNELANSFDALKIGKMPDFLSEAPKGANDNMGIRNAIAASIVALVIGYGVGFTTSQNQPDWRDYVASYQALYTNDTLKNVALSDEAKKAELMLAAASIGKDISIDKLNGSTELEYKRAQVLGYEGMPLIQIAFLDTKGIPIALCIIRSGDKQKLDVEMETMEGMSSAKWSKEGYEYHLIGGKDDALISKIASQFSSTI